MLFDFLFLKKLLVAVLSATFLKHLRKNLPFKELSNVEENDLENSCGICLEPIELEDSPFMTRCGQWFHYREGCGQSIYNKYECPFCRGPISEPLNQNQEVDEFFANESRVKQLEAMNIVELFKLLKYLIIIDAEPLHISKVISTLKAKHEWDVDSRFGNNNETLLMFAARVGNNQAMELLLSLGADKDAKDNAGHTAQFYAENYGQEQLSNDDLDEETKTEIMEKRQLCIEVLDFANVKISEKNEICQVCSGEVYMENRPFLAHCGHWFHNGKCCDFLLSEGQQCPTCRARINVDQEFELKKYRTFNLLYRGKDIYFTATKEMLIKLLKYSISIRSEKYIQYILSHLMTKKKWNVNERFENGQTMLTFAVLVGNDFAFKELLKAGADVNAETDGLNTYLNNAIPIPLGKMNLLLALQKQMTEFNIKDEELFLLNTAIRSGKYRTVEFLVKRGVDVNRPEKSTGLNAIQQLVLSDDHFLPILIEIIQNGKANLDVVDEHGQNLLHLAARAGNEKAMYYLVTEMYDSIDVNAVDNNYETPLMVACKREHPNLQIVRFLILAGAKADFSSYFGFSPLEHVVRCTDNNENLLKVLLESEPKVEERLIDWARDNLKESYARILEDYASKMMEKGDYLVRNSLWSMLRSYVVG